MTSTRDKNTAVVGNPTFQLRRQRSTPSFGNFNVLDGTAFDNYYDDLNEAGHPVTPPRPSKRSRCQSSATPKQRQSEDTPAAVSSLVPRALYSEGTVTVEGSSSASLDPEFSLSQLDALMYELNVEVDTETIRLGCLAIMDVFNRRSIHPDCLQALQFSLFEYHCLLSQSKSDTAYTAILSTTIDCPDQSRRHDHVTTRVSTDSGLGEDGRDDESEANLIRYTLDYAEAVILRQNRIVGRLLKMAAASEGLPGPAKNLERVLTSPAALTKIVCDERVNKTRSLLLAFINVLLVDVSSVSSPQSSDQLATLFEMTQHSLIELTGARQASSGGA